MKAKPIVTVVAATVLAVFMAAGASMALGRIRPVSSRPRIDIAFVLDTTGSMSGLIEGAKRKIWSIANAVAAAQPTPEIRMALVGYRDRGDAYVTRISGLTADLDRIYADLMEFEADGGGDSPESVNQALHEALVDLAWSQDDGTLRLIYLVGDAPPHTDYGDDTPYSVTCEKAARAGIIINTVQCGAMAETTPIWQEIARSAEGEFFQIDQAGGMAAVSTPYDEDLARLSGLLGNTFVTYGDADAVAEQEKKKAVSRKLARSAPAEALADRATYLASAAGRESFTGGSELIEDLASGEARLDEIDADHLPAEMQRMSVDERRRFVEAKAAERDKIRTEIRKLSEKRDGFLKDRIENAGPDGFDRRVLEALRRQAARKGIVFTTGT
jgi:Mg-chelatase subunit ChlD